MPFDPYKNPRRLVLVLGDQLDPASALFTDFDPHQDAIWMAEVRNESTHVWSHKARITLFLSAMRHFSEALKTPYWDFLMRHQNLLKNNPRMALQVRNLARLSKDTTRAIRSLAKKMKKKFTENPAERYRR